MTSAVVFAYHDVGVRCLAVLLARGVDVPLVVTHDDDPGENVWFGSVARFAREHDIPVVMPADPNRPDFVARVRGIAPDFLFSFYYRRMLGRPLLDTARSGALNMHGSLLPKFRGRAPVNWAVLKGATETGATLHYMTEKPDQGAIVAQHAVPILPDDQAIDVFRKVTCAAELALHGCLPALLSGSAPAIAQDLASGSYFSGRRPEDGRIDWSAAAPDIHNLVRAVAPPYPGAFTLVGGHVVRVLRARVLPGRSSAPGSAPMLQTVEGRIQAICGGGGILHLLEVDCDGSVLDAPAFARRFGTRIAPDPS